MLFSSNKGGFTLVFPDTWVFDLALEKRISCSALSQQLPLRLMLPSKPAGQVAPGAGRWRVAYPGLWWSSYFGHINRRLSCRLTHESVG